MDEELISKKDILDMTDISYGQLYRWKRKELIPEEWFIKKSSYTGQETYFPKEKILDRINKILELKDEMPLDELADMFSNRTKVNDMNEDYILNNGIIRSEILPIYKNIFGERKIYTFKDTLLMYILQNQFDGGILTINEIEGMMKIIDREYSTLETEDGTIYMIRRLGVGILVVGFKEPIIVDEGSKIVAEVNLKSVIDSVKFKLAL